jgi:hypothetical protein
MRKGYGIKLTKEEKKRFKRYSASACNPLINFYLKEAEGGGYYLTEEVKLWAYILTFIPIHLIQLILCIWDGGLKTFEISGRIVVKNDYLAWGSISWKTANNILKIYDENENRG